MQEESSSSNDEKCPEMCLVGNISSALTAILSKNHAAVQLVEEAIRWSDLQVLLAIAFLPHFLLKFINNQIINKTIRRKSPLEFQDTPFLSIFSEHVCQVGRLGLLVYFGELFIVFLSGLDVPYLDDKPTLLASLAYSLWMAQTASEISTTLLTRACSYKVCSQMTLWSRFLTIIIYLIVALLFLDANHIDIGMTMTYILTLGSVSSVMMGLALKDPLTEIVQGTNLLLSDKFSVGDVIQLSNGKTRGLVQSFEWMDVVMEGDDNSMTRIPHSVIAKTQIVNMTRMVDSQVSQTLALANHGPVKIETLLKSIQSEIRESCPKLNEQQPFRVTLTDLGGDNKIVISIESHYDIPRLSEEYWENRQAVLMAINRAVLEYNGE